MAMLLCVDDWVDLVTEIMAVKSCRKDLPLMYERSYSGWCNVAMVHFFKAPCKYN